MFNKVLIANRGEIAVRIAHTLQSMGICAATVYSDADAAAVHVGAADEAYHLPGVSAGETYLRGDRILELARLHDVDAIHPGYGFLSENAGFAKSCQKAGVTFIGPTPEVIEQMGDKIVAKRLMEAAGVPVVPGWSGEVDSPASEIQKEADRIGYPLLVKAAAGGGGKGMRLVERAVDLRSALESASREAGSAFGDQRVFLEKYVPRCRHVEFQIFGDSHGNAVHLFERECSIQRRHQKIIEETPCTALSDALRRKMGTSAVDAAKALGYQNAGTVEFILGEDGRYYFLEVNTRLQVEHPITEETTDQDLVRAQVLVAAGEALPFSGDALSQQGHAIECRVYAEDPANNFLPSVGTIGVYAPPTGPGIRVDSGVATGSEISVHYDPMIAKLICRGRDRDEAIRKTLWALRRFVILGVRHNVEFLRSIIEHPQFVAGATHTHFLAEHPLDHLDNEAPDEALIAALAGSLSGQRSGGASSSHNGANQTADGQASHSPWRSAGAWRALGS
jgi:acetyl-CoA carboxylase biotin carboxylase subunit